MQFHRRDVVNALWALGLPFPIAAVGRVVTTLVSSTFPALEDTTPFHVGVLVTALSSIPALGSAAGYVFARRLFVRHESAVAVIYLPLMCYALAWFSIAVHSAIFGGP